FAHLALHAVEPAARAHQLVLQPQHLLDACEVEPELARQLLDQAQSLDVRVRVQARVTGGALRMDETFALVDPKRLRMHADELCGDGDHVARMVLHQSRSSRHLRSCSSRRRIKTYVAIKPAPPMETRRIAASFTRRAPPSGSR